jgi:hypothetical protein
MRIRFLEIAEIELDEAIAYYNHEATGLGEAFLTKVPNTAFPLRNHLPNAAR